MTAGWAFPRGARKAHYMIDNRSVCGRWEYEGWLEPETGKRSTDDCQACVEDINNTNHANGSTT